MRTIRWHRYGHGGVRIGACGWCWLRATTHRHAGALAAEFGVETVAEPYRLGPWALCHHPGEIDGAYALAGHEHPVLALKGQGDRLRLPCFRFGARAGVLPAFGAFTGGHDVGAPRVDERRYVIGGDRVFRVGV